MNTVLGASGQISAGLIVLLVILALWSTVWKGLALWKAARLRQTLWFNHVSSSGYGNQFGFGKEF